MLRYRVPTVAGILKPIEGYFTVKKRRFSVAASLPNLQNISSPTDIAKLILDFHVNANSSAILFRLVAKQILTYFQQEKISPLHRFQKRRIQAEK